MRVGRAYGHTGKVRYLYGHAFYHYRVINGSVYRIGVFTYWIDGREEVSIERCG
jgi:hypothetical protein